jgi:hypothetical protein
MSTRSRAASYLQYALTTSGALLLRNENLACTQW